MKLASFVINNRNSFGFVLNEEAVVELDVAYQAAGLDPSGVPDNLLQLIEQYPEIRLDLEKVHTYALENELPTHSIDDLEWLPPVTRPSKIVGVACNNKNITDKARFCPNNAMFFIKPSSTLVGHAQPIEIYPDYGLTHPEAELGVIIGRRSKNLSMEEAMNAVFGYTILNDVTSVTLKSGDTIVFPNPGVTPPPPGWEHGEKHLTYHARSKGTDTFGPCGPWVVTKSELADPDNLAVKVYMGDELCTEDLTANLNYSVAEVLYHLTKYMTLEPGDIIHMGTASKGKYQLRDLNFQKWDGPCSIEIEGIGRLSNPIKRLER